MVDSVPTYVNGKYLYTGGQGRRWFNPGCGMNEGGERKTGFCKFFKNLEADCHIANTAHSVYCLPETSLEEFRQKVIPAEYRQIHNSAASRKIFIHDTAYLV